jgi:hypothetical protein
VLNGVIEPAAHTEHTVWPDEELWPAGHLVQPEALDTPVTAE